MIGNGAEFENDTRLNREPVKIFQKWDKMGKLRGLCQPKLSSYEHTEGLESPQMQCYKEESCINQAY